MSGAKISLFLSLLLSLDFPRDSLVGSKAAPSAEVVVIQDPSSMVVKWGRGKGSICSSVIVSFF